MRGAAIVALLACALPACLGPGDFRCQEHKQCSGAGASCEADGHCSIAVAESSCPSRRRYVHNAGAAADTCVPDSCVDNPIGNISAGGAHACLVRANGAIWCWGRNDDGQLGDGTRTPRSLPVRLTGLKAAAVAAGQRHTCAVDSERKVYCWGADDLGQLGDGGGVDRLSPVPVPGVEGALSVAAGADFSCAVLTDRTVTCWGDDTLGQLGDGGAAATTRLPSPVSSIDGVLTLSAFSQHACAVRADGSLWCWGANAQGQLGDGTTTNQKRPVAVPTLTGVTAVGTGLSHTCAIADMKLTCWGSNASGQIGNGGGGAADPPVTVPAQVPGISAPRAVALGAQHTCAVQIDGPVLCWGQDGSGQVGLGPIAMLPSPAQVAGLGKGKAITAGTAFSCAETEDGALFCWGDNHQGQLGMASGTIRTLPEAVPDVASAAAISVGGAHTCVATAGVSSGAARRDTLCWGADQAGQLGDADTTDRARARSVTGEIDAVEIAAGAAHTCAVTSSDAALWCWGRGNGGQLGLGATFLHDVRQPTKVTLPPVTLPPSATNVAAGTAHTCTIAGGAVVCFGANASGQLGDGTTMDRPLPVPVSLGGGTSAATATGIAAGGAHTCALDAAGQIWCWGRGGDGEIGDGSSMDRPAPVAVTLPGGVSVTAVSAGDTHTCAVTSEGDLYCWGRGREGQLGTGATSVPIPTRVPGISGATDVAAGAAHTCVIEGDRTVQCFGANDSGQLGNGATGASAAPEPVQGLSDVHEIGAGVAHTCARRGDGTIWCWGADTSGQLGDGITLTASSPQLARVACQ